MSRTHYPWLRGVFTGLLVLCCGSLVTAAHAAPPMLTVYGLVVNELNAPCGQVVQAGDQVCVSYSSDQNANVTVGVQKDSGPVTTVSHGTIVANAMNQTCVTAGPADGITRTFRISISNPYGSDADSCSYVVGSAPSSTAPDLTLLGLRVNGASASCGSTVTSGDQVCVRFRSDQNGTATVSVQKGATTTVVSSGPVTAGVSYVSCVSAGPADNIPRTFKVRVSNAHGSDTETCGYNVGAASPNPPSVTIPGLRVNGTTVACGAAVHSGNQVCVRFSSDQSANANVSVKKGATTTVVANGSVAANVSYFTCVAAGTGDAITRSFIVRAANANGVDSEICDYTVVP